MAKAKGETIASGASLERIESDDKIYFQSHSTTHSIERYGNDVDNNASTEDDNDIGKSTVLSTYLEGSYMDREVVF